MRLRELRQRRGALIQQMRDMLDAAGDTDLSAEDQTRYDALDTEQRELGERIAREERQAELDHEMNSISGERRSNPGQPGSGGNAGEPGASESRFVPPSGPVRSWSPEQRAAARSQPEYRGAWVSAMAGRPSPDELRTLQVGIDTQGGYLAPPEFERTVRELLRERSVMRGLADVQTSVADIEIPVETSVPEFAWVAENGAFPATDATFGVVKLRNYKLGGYIKVTHEELQDAIIDIEGYLRRKFVDAADVLEEAGFVAGNGVGKPFGVSVEASVGVTGASATSVKADELIDLFHSLVPRHRARARFMMNDQTARDLRKLKDGNGQYIWQPGLQAGQPDLLLAKPIVITDSMPVMAASARSILFGDFSAYRIQDRSGLSFQRLDELFASNGQVGFLGYERTDGRLLLAEAMKAFVNHA